MVGILHRVFLKLLMLEIVIILLDQIHISGVMFEVRRVKFLENFYLWYSQVSYQNKY